MTKFNYIARDVRKPTGNEVHLDLEGRNGSAELVAVFKGATGAHLFARLVGALGRAGDTVRTEDGTYMAGSLGQLMEQGK